MRYKDVEVMLTNKCNLKCAYCAQKHQPENMSIETFDSLPIDYENDRVTLFGGEPTLNRELLNHIVSKGIKKLVIITNSTVVFTEKFLKNFREIHLSCNEFKDYEKLMINLETCRINKLPFNVNIVVSDSTIDHIEKMTNSIYFDKIFFMPDFTGRVSENTISKFEYIYNRHVGRIYENMYTLESPYVENTLVRYHIKKYPTLCGSDTYKENRVAYGVDGTEYQCDRFVFSSITKADIKNIDIDDYSKDKCYMCEAGCNICVPVMNVKDNKVRMPEGTCKLTKVIHAVNLKAHINYMREKIRLLEQK
ncbi:MAG: radical SAM protein [Paraclostridium sp.]